MSTDDPSLAASVIDGALYNAAAESLRRVDLESGDEPAPENQPVPAVGTGDRRILTMGLHRRNERRAHRARVRSAGRQGRADREPARAALRARPDRGLTRVSEARSRRRCSSPTRCHRPRARRAHGDPPGALTSSAALLIARALRARIPVATYVGITSLSAAPILLLAGTLMGSSFVPADGHQAGLLLGIALLPHLVGHTALTWAIGWLPAPRVALVILGEPVGATLLAWAFLDQTPRPLTFVGAALVMTAVALSLRPTAPKPAA